MASASQNAAAVEQLRQLHAVAEGEYRCQAALQLGLVLADLVAELPDDDERLRALAEEGLQRLDEGVASAGATAPTSAVERARAVLSGRIPAPPPFALRPEILGLMGQLDPAAMRSTVEAVRLMMPDMPADSPTRLMMQTVLRLFDTGLIDDFQSGRWKPEYDGALASLDRLESDLAAAGGRLDSAMSSMISQMSRRLHEVRESSGKDMPPAPVHTPAADPKPPNEPHWPTATEIQQLLRAMPGLEIALSVMPEDDPARQSVRILVETNRLLNAVATRQWNAEHDRALADLRQIVGDAELESDEAVEGRASVVLVRAMRCQMAEERHSPEDRPDPDELADVVADIEEVLDDLPKLGPAGEPMAGTLRASAVKLLLRIADQTEQAEQDVIRRLVERARGHLSKVPPEVVGTMQEAIAGIARIERLMGDEVGDGVATNSFGDRNGSFDTGTQDLSWIADKAARARLSGTVPDLTAAIEDLHTVRRGLPAGHPGHISLMILTADLLGWLSVATRSPEKLVDAIEAAIEAVREATPNLLSAAVRVLVQLLGNMVTTDPRVGPFGTAEAALLGAADRVDHDDAQLRLMVTLGLAGTRILRARANNDGDLRRRARETLVEAEQLLGEPAPVTDWVAPAWLILAWAASHAMVGADRDAAPLVARMADRLEGLLTAHPELAEQMSTQFRHPGPFPLGQGGQAMVQGLRVLKDMTSVLAGDGPLATFLGQVNPTMFRSMQFSTMPPSSFSSPPPAAQTREQAVRGLERAQTALSTDDPDPDSLRTACTDLRAALAGGLDDDSLRQQVNGTLGVCLAELCELGDSDISTLTDAIRHLDSALAGSQHQLPTPERADLMDRLACCYRRSADRGLSPSGRADAERSVRAALRELARCVLVADGTEQALTIAAQANQTVARAVDWCLTDRRPGAAAEIAEAGRSLVLASVVLSGQVESVLRGAGEDAAADAWSRDDAGGKLASLNTLWQTKLGTTLLNTPSADEISTMLMVATPVTDGLVYLVPPAASDSPAHAIAFRAGLSGDFELIELPTMRTGAGTSLADYLASFGTAVDGYDPGQRATDGFRGTPCGQTWTRALEDLGAWAYEHLVGPLIAHVRGWSPGRTPHLVLVPLGEFTAIPYAAAWTADPELPGGRRYAIHDLVLTQAVSARLLSEVARRPHQPLTERVVLVPDPTGQFPYARAIARQLASVRYPNAEVYGRQTPNGPATVDRILAALPGSVRQGASLFQLSTHATCEPTPRLQAQDGWLALSRILEQARGRANDAAGGLIITNACLTDSTRSHYDESVTLTTALLAAGATGVIGARWPIDDDTTAIFTYNLHHRLALGNSPAEAVRLAQIDMLDPRHRPGLHPHLAAVPHARVAHPASWAAFTYHGT